MLPRPRKHGFLCGCAECEKLNDLPPIEDKHPLTGENYKEKDDAKETEKRTEDDR